MNKWTTPADIRNSVMREWERGHLLSMPLLGETLYPWRLTLKCPAGAETLAAEFDAVRRWIKTLADGAKPGAKPEGGNGYRLEYREINHRQLGRNSLPVAAWLDSEEDALALIGKRREATRFRQLAAMLETAFPSLRAWLARRPLAVLEHADTWPELLGVLRWIADHPCPDVYLRQIDVPGVHSKFIERYRALLGELLELILPAEAVDAASPRGVGGFEQRYGLRAKPLLVRFRLPGASETLQGLTDLSVPAAEFARLALPVARAFVTENEINFLALPMAPGDMAIFGAGYGFEAIAAANWLDDKTLFYWGDIDTHGFAILDQLRSRFPQARSLLMDRETLFAHQSLWGQESTPTQRDLSRLTGDEARLYDELRDNRIAPALRLEQERIGYAWVEAALRAVD